MPTSLPTASDLLLIGAGPGLGASIAHRFGREGFSVTLVARREEALADLAGDLRRAGVDVNTFTADAGDTEAFRTRLEEFADQSAPGVVVYNAALITSDGILSDDVTHFAAAYAVDVLGAVTAAQVFTPAMRRAGAGTFLVTGGGLGIHPHRDYASISVGKAGLRAAMTLLHDELEDDGVRDAETDRGDLAGELIAGHLLLAGAAVEGHVQGAEVGVVDRHRPRTHQHLPGARLGTARSRDTQGGAAPFTRAVITVSVTAFLRGLGGSDEPRVVRRGSGRNPRR